MMDINTKIKFKLDNGIVSEEYSLIDIIDIDTVYEDLEAKHGCDGNCTNESVSYCVCGGLFDKNIIVELIID